MEKDLNEMMGRDDKNNTVAIEKQVVPLTRRCKKGNGESILTGCLPPSKIGI